MAVLRSVDGKFYDVPDDQLEKFAIPEEQVNQKLQGARTARRRQGRPGPPPVQPGQSEPIIVRIYTTGGAGAPGSDRGPDAGPPPSREGTDPPADSEVTAYGAGDEGGGGACGSACGGVGTWHNGWQNWHNIWHNSSHSVNCGT